MYNFPTLYVALLQIQLSKELLKFFAVPVWQLVSDFDYSHYAGSTCEDLQEVLGSTIRNQ